MYIEPTFSYVYGIFLTSWTSVTLRCPAPHDDITASAGVRLHSSHLIVLTSPYLLATPLHSSWLAGSTHLCSLIGDFLPSKLSCTVSRAPQRRQQTQTQSVLSSCADTSAANNSSINVNSVFFTPNV